MRVIPIVALKKTPLEKQVTNSSLLDENLSPKAKNKNIVSSTRPNTEGRGTQKKKKAKAEPKC